MWVRDMSANTKKLTAWFASLTLLLALPAFAGGPYPEGTSAALLDLRKRLEISAGEDPGYISVNKFGYNGDVDLNNTETIWNCPDLTSPANASFRTIYELTYRNSAQILYVSSPDAGLTDVQITLEGLDGNGNLTTKTVSTDATNGQNPVAVPGSWNMMHRAYVSGDVNLGLSEIIIHNDPSPVGGNPDTPTSDTLGCILASNNNTLMGVYVIPTGYTGFLQHVRIGSSRTSGASGSGIIRLLDPGGEYRTQFILGTTADKDAREDYEFPIPIAAGTLVEMTYASGTNDTKAFGKMQLILRKD